MPYFRVRILAVLTCLTAAVHVSAQGGPGQVIGVVKDAQGGVIPGVAVTLSGPAAPQALAAVTNSNGSFQIQNVPAGTYTLRAAIAGFFPFTQADVIVRAGQVTQTISTLACCPPVPAQLIDRAEPVLARVRIATSAGNIDLELDTVHAPITAGNFLKYVDAGLYNGGRFYRVTREGNYTPSPPNRPLMEIIQGGLDPSKSAQRFPPIPLERTTVTGLHHGVGVISMARGTAADTATSEFFILLNDQPSLDMGGKRFDDEQGAAAFGKVIAGMDVVRTINQGPTNGDRLVTPVVIESVTRIK